MLRAETKASDPLVSRNSNVMGSCRRRVSEPPDDTNKAAIRSQSQMLMKQRRLRSDSISEQQFAAFTSRWCQNHRPESQALALSRFRHSGGSVASTYRALHLLSGGVRILRKRRRSSGPFRGGR
jgi:hypothetical protein